MSLLLLGILNSQAAGGGAGAFDLLETTTLTSSASSVTFSGLGAYSDYKHLQIRALARTDRASALDLLSVRLNADTGSNYAWHSLRGGDSNVTSTSGASSDNIETGYAPGGTYTANVFSGAVIDFLDYANSSKSTTIRILSGYDITSVSLNSGLWNNTAAVTSINLYPLLGTNLVAGSRFSLMGVK